MSKSKKQYLSNIYNKLLIMKKSEFKEFIKNEIISTLEEAEFNVKADDTKAMDTAKKAAGEKDNINVMSEADDEEIDKQASASAKKGKKKASKLDNAIKDLNAIKKSMGSNLKKYKKAETDEDKQSAIDDLKKQTVIKKELESLVKRLEGDVIK